jgi:hypothetical protein
MRRSIFLACVVALSLLSNRVQADDVILKGGGKVSGRILSRTATAVEVDIGAGTVTLPMTSVVRIEERRSSLDDYYERAEKLRADDREGWLELAKWASSQGLGSQARAAYERVLAVDPANAEANQGVGRVLLDGRWVTEEESYTARGYVRFEGEWVTAAEQDAILKRQAATEQAEWARLDAEQRAREAQARAAEAEARAREAEAASVVVGAGFPMYWGGWGPGPSVWPTRPIAAPGRPAPRPRQ